MRSSGPRRVTAFLASAALLLSSTAAGATVTVSSASTAISPWAALSAFGTQASRASLCGATAAVAGAAAAAQAVPGQPGCVLPVVDAPPPIASPGPPPAPVPPPMIDSGGGFGISPLLLGLGALALGGLIYLLVKDDDDEPDSPA